MSVRDSQRMSLSTGAWVFCVVTPVLKQKSEEPGCCPLESLFERLSQKHLPEMCRQTGSTAEGANVSFAFIIPKT